VPSFPNPPAFPDLSPIPDFPDTLVSAYIPAFPDPTSPTVGAPDVPSFPDFPISRNFCDLDGDDIPGFPEFAPAMAPPFPESDSALLPPVPDSNEIVAFPEPDSGMVPLYPVPDSDTATAAFPEPNLAIRPAFPEPDFAITPAFPEPDSAAMPTFEAPTIPLFPEPSLVGVQTPPVLSKSAIRSLREFKEQRTIIGLAELPTINEMSYYHQRGQQIPLSKNYAKRSKRSTPPNGNPPPKRQRKGKSTFVMSSTSLQVSISANKIASGSGPSNSQVPSPPAIKKDRGELFRRLGDKRKVDPKYFKVQILSIVLLSLG
jgi:hypothetical protein